MRKRVVCIVAALWGLLFEARDTARALPRGSNTIFRKTCTHRLLWAIHAMRSRDTAGTPVILKTLGINHD